jgi:hypothetical protein
VASVAFGLYAWLPDTPHAIQHAGSGVFIANRLALTAKHVTEDMERLDRSYDPSKPARDGFVPEYSTMLYQIERFKQPIRWANEILWPSRDTDICMLHVVPDTRMARIAERFCLAPALFEWHLRPPPIGAHVTLFGFPRPTLANEGNRHAGGVQFVEQDGIVEEIFEPIRTHGMLEFPCYRLSKPVDHAFSGGPVLYDGALAGIVSAGSTFDQRAWIASLWPLVLMKFGVAEGESRHFGDLFLDGTLRARDWAAVNGHVRRMKCDDALAGSHVTGRCDREHAVFLP